MMRLRTLVMATLVLLTIAPSAFATCFYCSYYQDCFMAGGIAARCYSYGTACMTSGRCNSEEPCTVGSGCGPDVAFTRPAVRPLNLDYQLTAVQISRPAAASRAAVVAQISTARRN